MYQILKCQYSTQEKYENLFCANFDFFMLKYRFISIVSNFESNLLKTTILELGLFRLWPTICPTIWLSGATILWKSGKFNTLKPRWCTKASFFIPEHWIDFQIFRVFSGIFYLKVFERQIYVNFLKIAATHFKSQFVVDENYNGKCLPWGWEVRSINFFQFLKVLKI